MEGSEAPTHSLRYLPAVEIQSHLCLGTCSPWKSPEEQAGSKDLGVQEVKKATSLVQQSWSPGRTSAAPPGLRLPIPALRSSTSPSPHLANKHPWAPRRAETWGCSTSGSPSGAAESIPVPPAQAVGGRWGGLVGSTAVAWAGSRDAAR